jgi:hypothetical protein
LLVARPLSRDLIDRCCSQSHFGSRSLRVWKPRRDRYPELGDLWRACSSILSSASLINHHDASPCSHHASGETMQSSGHRHTPSATHSRSVSWSGGAQPLFTSNHRNVCWTAPRRFRSSSDDVWRVASGYRWPRAERDTPALSSDLTLATDRSDLTIVASDVNELLAALSQYRSARSAFLSVLGCAESNRDPFAEFAERLAHAVLGGELAASRVQKNYDLTTPSGEQVQVRYLANPRDRWVNEHYVDFRAPCDRYALLVVEGFDPKALIVFTRSTIAAVCSALVKRHPNQESGLALTRRNYLQLRAEPEQFALLGVQVVALD